MCVCVRAASCRVLHYLPCYLFVTVLHSFIALGSKARITATVSQTEGEFLFGLRLDRGPGLCYTSHIMKNAKGVFRHFWCLSLKVANVTNGGFGTITPHAFYGFLVLPLLCVCAYIWVCLFRTLRANAIMCMCLWERVKCVCVCVCKAC